MAKAPYPTPQDGVDVPYETLQDHVYKQLRHSIMVGRFRPGEAFKIRALAETFATSIQPVREAIRQLIAEGALEASPNASTRVPRLSRAQLEDLRDMRIAIEGLAAERAMMNMKPKDIAELTAILADQHEHETGMDNEDSVAHNLAFHFRLYSHAGSEILPLIIEGLWLRVGPSIRESAEIFGSRTKVRDTHHREIIRALRKRDAEGLKLAIIQDISRFFDVLIASEGQPKATVKGQNKRRKRSVEGLSEDGKTKASKAVKTEKAKGTTALSMGPESLSTAGV